MIIETLSRSGVENIIDHYPKLFERRDLFDDYDPDDTIILISIGNPGQSTGDVDDSLFDDVLRLHFHDADPDVDHGTVAGMKMLNNGQVVDAINFVEDHDPDFLFVQCQAGQSRSCGMAYAFHQHYNDGDLKDGWNTYNRYVHRKIKDGLRGFSKDSDYYDDLFS